MSKKAIVILAVIIVVCLFLFTKSNRKMKYPVKGKITSKYGNRTHPVTGVASSFHSGVDIAVSTGTAVISPADGTVKSVFSNSTGGNQLIIEHTNGFRTGYAHLKQSLVAVGDKVKNGQKVAETGNTGASTGPHLHLTLRQNGNLVNPEDFFTV